jgi:hypothetical protein
VRPRGRLRTEFLVQRTIVKARILGQMEIAMKMEIAIKNVEIVV